MWIEPVTLDGRWVRLEPLTHAHAAGLWAASSDPELYRFMPYVLRSEDDVHRFIDRGLENHAQGGGLTFVTIERSSERPVGSSGFYAADPHHRRVEIGGTWLAPAWQRTPINTEAKLLMLRHAFATLGCLRVEFKTDSLNQRSRSALTRIGAVEEGTFRNHMVMPDGRIRHSVYFSITVEEWPAVGERLEGLLAR
jgi:RimJ/RimL family protein N-acetyltransferase